MKKILMMVPVLLFLFLLVPVQAQMMGRPSVTQEEQLSTTQDEAAGKAVLDKLQNKEVTCQDLKDDDFDVLGDFFMGNMMGINHASMNKMMIQRLGEGGEKQMHIAMGRRLSGCDTSAPLPQGSGYFAPMMGNFSGMMGGSVNRTGVMSYLLGSNTSGSVLNMSGSLVWILAVVFLLLGIIYFLKGMNRKK